MSSRTRITLREMAFHVRVGILPHERELPQPLSIDVTVTLAGDDPPLLDYRELHALVARVVQGGPLDYLESIGDAIARAALARPEVSDVRVALRKPHVALPGPLACAEVVVERDRG